MIKQLGGFVLLKKTYIIAIIILLFITLAGCGNSRDDNTIRFGVIPADDAEEMLSIYKPVADYLEEVLGAPVELIALYDYTAAIEAMRTGDLDIAWFGPFAYLLAVERAGAEAIAIGVRGDTGLSTYRTIFVTHSSSSIYELSDLKGKTFAFVDPASTSGHLIPRSILLNYNIDPESDFSTMLYAGTHNSVLLAINGQNIDAGATSDNVLKRMVDEGLINEDNIRIIYESVPIPGSPIAVSGSLDEELKTKIQNAFVNMPDEIAAGWGGIAYYETIDDSHYDILREVARNLNMLD